MQRQLTVEEIEIFKEDMKKVYEEAKLPQETHGKLIENAIQALNDMLTWTEAFKQNVKDADDTMLKFMDSLINKTKTEDEEYKKAGCSDADFQDIQNKMMNMPLCQLIRIELKEAMALCKPKTSKLNPDRIPKMIAMLQNMQSLFDMKVFSLSEEDKTLDGEIRTLNQGLKDPNIIKVLTMRQEEAQSLIQRSKKIGEEVTNFKDENISNKRAFLAKKEKELLAIAKEIEKIKQGVKSYENLVKSFHFFKPKNENNEAALVTEKNVTLSP